MNRLQQKRNKQYNWECHTITPKTLKLVEKFKKWSGSYYSAYASYNLFEVTTIGG